MIEEMPLEAAPFPVYETNSFPSCGACTLPAACMTALFKHTMEAVVVVDLAGDIVCVNDAFELHTGFCRAEVVGENPRVLKSGQHDAAFYQRLWDTVTSGEPWREHVVNRCRDGSLINVQQVITPVFSKPDEITHFMSIWRNVTRERELLEMVRKSQRMEQLGQLTAQIAHDFNNALTGVYGFAELLITNAERGSDDASMLREIVTCAHRASKLAKQLLHLGKPRSDGNDSADVNIVVTQMLPFLRRTLGRGIKVAFHPNWEAMPAGIDHLQMEQIILNLCVNARDAMPSGGTVTIRSEVLPAPSSGNPHRKMVCLTVSDTGTGMSAETASHVFEPFFTTKGETGGTGLGLAIVQGILEEIEGTVEVESEEGRGTEFRVLFPLGRDATTTSPAVGLQKLIRGTGSVLVIDPDPSLRHTAEEMLSHLGYTAFTTKDSIGALELAANIRCDVAIVDADLPLLTGDKLIHRLRESLPNIRFLLATPMEGSQSHSESEVFAILRKPYSIGELSRVVHDAMGRGVSSHQEQSGTRCGEQ